jgi:hypothetical protein
MSETAQLDVRAEEPKAPPQDRAPLLDRTAPLLALFLAVGLIVFVFAFLTVHARKPDVLLTNSGAIRTNWVLSHWLHDGYFHYFGMTARSKPGEKVVIYRTSTGGYMLSTFIAEKVYGAFTGRYSWRLVAWHNEVIALLLSALLGLLAYRVTRRIGLDAGMAFAAGACVVMVVFTFPDNLALYWEMSSQAYALLFAVVFLLLEERSGDGERTFARSIGQAAAVFLMAYMEKIVALAFIAAVGVTLALLKRRRGAWRRYLFVTLTPCLAALALYGFQLRAVEKRFPDIEMMGSTFMFRSGLDGESLLYGDHLDIARRRDVARRNWSVNHDALFRWTWVFILGTISTLATLAAYIAGRAPRIAVDVLASLAGAWLLYAAVFSQAVMIHPYLYDVLLFAPLVVALFAIAPTLAESLTRRTGTILMVTLFCACWYSLFQMRLYALRYPMPGTQVGAPPPNAASH